MSLPGLRIEKVIIMGFTRHIKQIVGSQRKQPKLAFLHIPKTGGSYIVQEDDVLTSMRNLGHSSIVDKPGIANPLYAIHDPTRTATQVTLFAAIQQYIVFATTRNIFSWLVSYSSHAGGWNPNYHDPDHYDYDNARKGFDYWR